MSGKFPKWKIYKNQEKDFLEKSEGKINFRYLWIPRKYFWQILFIFWFASFVIHKLPLFLFVQKLALQIYSYLYSQENILFAEDWFVGLNTEEATPRNMVKLLTSIEDCSFCARSFFLLKTLINKTFYINSANFI